jgi:Zn-dependent peptidase ImmA (M78 family)
MAQSRISKIENGISEPASLEIEKIARATGVNRAFFFQSEEIHGLGSTFVFNRKRQNVPLKIQRAIQANVNIMSLQAKRLLLGAEIVVSNKFERLDMDQFAGRAEKAARFLRAHWAVPLGPVANVTRLVEAAGGIVFVNDFGTDQIDAAHMWLPGMPPMFFMNSALPPDRYRFNLAHELAHALLHRFVTGDCEDEANAFASEFLMPKEEISRYLDSMTLEKAARLKAIWKTSMHAIIYRAKTLGKISERQFTRLMQTMGARGYRKAEPIDFPREEPNTVKELVKVHRDFHHYTDDDLNSLLFRSDPQFLRATPPQLRLFVG